jgi:serine/threonine protein kinase
MSTPVLVVGKIQEGAFGVVMKMQVDGRTVARKYFRTTEQYGNEVAWNEVIGEKGRIDNRSKFAIKMYNSGYDQKRSEWYLDMEFALKALYDVAVSTDAHLTGCLELDTPTKVESLFTDLLSGLDFLHSSVGMLHNDLKPENILLKSDGTFVYCDFGFATAITSSYKIHGTVAYAAPEHFDDRKTVVDATSDVFSLGITLLFVLDGYPAVPLPTVTFSVLEQNVIAAEKDVKLQELMKGRICRHRYLNFFKHEFNAPTAVGRNLKSTAFKWQYAAIIASMVHPFDRPGCARLLQTFQRLMQRD